MSWRCPYCNQNATKTSNDVSSDNHTFDLGNRTGHRLGLRTYVTVCPNGKCKEATIVASLHTTTAGPSGSKLNQPPLLSWTLKPQSSAKPFPDYVPSQIRQDYEEACAILSLSPKASATLSRRCLQGMIRDYWKIRKKSLNLEVQALKPKVGAKTWKAIDAVRQIGNIGAHMEKNINTIIDVDPDEAQALSDLIEILIQEWYVRRFETDGNMDKIISAAAAKKDQKNQPATTVPAPPTPDTTGWPRVVGCPMIAAALSPLGWVIAQSATASAPVGVSYLSQ